jgi:hypothetical protein
MSKFLDITSEWTGGDTRQAAASITAYAIDGAKFDTRFGVGYVVRPGGGTTGNDAECVASIQLTPDTFTIVWNSTGGQNHTIKLKFLDDSKVKSLVGSTGPKNVTSKLLDNVTDN